MARNREIRRVVIANRGEAAMRCVRAVKALRAQERSRIQVVALYTHPDRDAPFVRYADNAILWGLAYIGLVWLVGRIRKYVLTRQQLEAA